MVRSERRRALHEAIVDLRRYRQTFDLDAFLGSRDAQRMVLQALYVAVQACLDEAFELCRDRSLGASGTYRDSFLALGHRRRQHEARRAVARVIDAALAGRLADWASFRNVLAQFYPVVDNRKVYTALSELEDIERFAEILDQLAPQ